MADVFASLAALMTSFVVCLNVLLDLSDDCMAIFDITTSP